MNLIWLNVKKDVRHLLVVVGLWFATLTIQTILDASVPSMSGRPGLWTLYQMVSYLAPALQYLLLVIMIPLVVQQDSLVDARAFWLTRPISRRTLLAGKALFVGLIVMLPVVLGDVIVLACSGLNARLVWLALPEIVLEVAARACLIGVLAALTSTFARFAILGVCYLIGSLILGLLVSALLPLVLALFPLHAAHVASYDQSTGMMQAQRMGAAIATIVCGSGVLAWQYLTRRRKTTIVLALLGVLCVMVVRHACPFFQVRPAPAQPSASLDLAIKGITPNDIPVPGGKRLQSLNIAFTFQNKQRATLPEIGSGFMTLTPADNRPRSGVVMYDFSKHMVGFTGGEFAESYPPSVALSEAIARDLGSVRLLNPGTNVAEAAATLPATLQMNAGVDFEACVGQKVAVTGDVEVTVYGYNLAAIAPLRNGSFLAHGLDSDRVLHAGDEKAPDIRIRRRMVNLAFAPDKQADTLMQRMSPWQDTVYLLINRKAGNEVALCESVTLDDLFFLMTMSLRMMNPPRLDYCDAKLVFPALTAAWLKDAELVCFKKTRLGSFRKAIGAKDLLVGSAAMSPSTPAR